MHFYLLPNHLVLRPISSQIMLQKILSSNNKFPPTNPAISINPATTIPLEIVTTNLPLIQRSFEQQTSRTITGIPLLPRDESMPAANVPNRTDDTLHDYPQTKDEWNFPLTPGRWPIGAQSVMRYPLAIIHAYGSLTRVHTRRCAYRVLRSVITRLLRRDVCNNQWLPSPLHLFLFLLLQVRLTKGSLKLTKRPVGYCARAIKGSPTPCRYAILSVFSRASFVHHERPSRDWYCTKCIGSQALRMTRDLSNVWGLIEVEVKFDGRSRSYNYRQVDGGIGGSVGESNLWLISFEEIFNREFASVRIDGYCCRPFTRGSFGTRVPLDCLGTARVLEGSEFVHWRLLLPGNIAFHEIR